MPLKNNSKFDLILFQKIFGHLFFGVLLFFSLFYAKERLTYVDSAWQFFARVNDEGFVFPFLRYGVFFSELPLFLGIKLHLPLHTLMYIFSASYIVLYFLIWRWVTYSFKDPVAGLTLLLCLFMGQRESFLHTVGELQQAIPYSVLLYAIMNFDEWRSVMLKWTLSIACVFLVLFTHPLGAFAAGFAVLFLILKKGMIRKEYLVVLSIVVITVLVRFFFPDNINDAAQYQRVKGASSIFQSITESGVLRFLLIHSQHFYWLPELLLLVTIGLLMMNRKWWWFVVLLSSVFFYLILVIVTFHNGDSSIMVERLFLPAFFMINLIFADQLFRLEAKRIWFIITFLLFLTVNGIRYLNAGCLYYQKREEYLAELIKKTNEAGTDKGFIKKEDLDPDRILVTWALGTETLLYSTLTDGKSKIVSFENGKRLPGTLQLADQSMYLPEGLNKRYFNLTNKEYIQIK